MFSQNMAKMYNIVYFFLKKIQQFHFFQLKVSTLGIYNLYTKIRRCQLKKSNQ